MVNDSRVMVPWGVLATYAGVVTLLLFFVEYKSSRSFIKTNGFNGKVVSISHGKSSTIELGNGVKFKQYPLFDRRKNYEELIDINIGDVVEKDYNSPNIYINNQLAVDELSWSHFTAKFWLVFYIFIGMSFTYILSWLRLRYRGR